MSKKFSPQVLFVLVFTLVAQATFAKELVPFASDEGLARLQRSTMKAGAFKLMNHYRTQIDKVSCGLVTSAIVLNALRSGTGKAPLAPMKPEFIKGFPFGRDGNRIEGRLPVYTPENFMNEAAEKIKPLNVVYFQTGANPGLTLNEMARILVEAHGLDVQEIVVGTQQTAAVPATETAPSRAGTLPLDVADKVLLRVQHALRVDNTYVIANYHRVTLGQKGGGHISPIAAYDLATDSYLILDVNPLGASWVWADSESLIEGLNSYDSDAKANRGLLIVREKQQN